VLKRLIPQQLKKELLLNKKKLVTMSMLMFLIKVLKIICCKKIQESLNSNVSILRMLEAILSILVRVPIPKELGRVKEDIMNSLFYMKNLHKDGPVSQFHLFLPKRQLEIKI